MKLLTNNSGATLIETVVAGTVATVVGFVIYSVTFVYTNESSASISRFLMQQQYDNVSSQIARDVHRSSYVLAQGETPDIHGAGFDSSATIQLYDAAKQLVTQYSIVNGTLYEGAAQKIYTSGGSPVKVAGNSCFIINPQRTGITLHLSLSKPDNKTTHTLSLRREMILCRN